MNNYLIDKDYKTIYSKVPRLCVDLFLIKDSLVFMTMRDIEPFNRMWHLPGGGIRFNESIKECIKRLALDEVNCIVTNYRQIGFIECPNEILSDYSRHSISMVFQCEAINPKRGSFIDVKNEENILPFHKEFLKRL